MRKAKQIPDWCILDHYLFREIVKENSIGMETRYSNKFKPNLFKKKLRVIKLKQP